MLAVSDSPLNVSCFTCPIAHSTDSVWFIEGFSHSTVSQFIPLDKQFYSFFISLSIRENKLTWQNLLLGQKCLHEPK